MTGDQLRHRYVVNRLQERFDVRGVVTEAASSPRPAGDDEDARVIAAHFADRARAERRFFGDDARLMVAPERCLALAKGEANARATLQWILATRAEWLVLFGCSLIDEALLDAFGTRCVNLHLGLSPYYRGSGTNFWPLVRRQPELVGATIHLATRRIDGGPIVAQARPSLEPDDRAHEIGCRAIAAGTRALIDGLERLARGALSPRPQASGGRLCTRAEFTAEAVRAMWRHLETGMVPEYLAHPERADRYPIMDWRERCAHS